MKRKLLVLVAILAMALMAAPAMASTITFTVTGTDSAGDPIAAAARLTTGAGTVTVDLWNTLVGIKDAGQTISDLFFALSTGQTAATLSSSSGLERTVASGGTFTDGSHVATGWAVSADGIGIELDVLGTAIGPAHTILGLPLAATPTDYSPNANGSIAGNGPHNPFLFGTSADPVEFVLAVAGVTAASTVTNVVFSFGTVEGDNHPGTQVPIPPSALLLGSGLLGLVGLGWRRKRG